MIVTNRMLCLSALAALLFAGCDKEQLEEAVSVGVQQATETVEQTVETVKQEARLVGSMDLQTSPPLAAKACYAELIVIGEGRPNVLRLTSHKSTDLERFPSVLVEAQVEAATLSDLAGQTVHAQVFAQHAEEGPVWQSPVSMTIALADDQSLVCECQGDALANSDSDEQASVSGKFVAIPIGDS